MIALYVATSSSSCCIVVALSASVCVSTDTKQVSGGIVVVAGGVSVCVIWSDEGDGRLGAVLSFRSNSTHSVSAVYQSSVAILSY